jgi:hypothetical protein
MPTIGELFFEHSEKILHGRFTLIICFSALAKLLADKISHFGSKSQPG